MTDKGRPTAVEHDDHPTSLRTALKTTKFIIFFSAWVACGAFMIMFDLSYGGNVLRMDAFNASFGTCKMVPNPVSGVLQEVCTLSAVAQSMVSVTGLFTALGAGLTAITGVYLGRRDTIQMACLIIIIGAAGQLGTAGNYVAYNVCKSISCVGIGQLNATIPLYGVEVTPPQKRGLLVGLFNLGLALGTLISAAVCFGSSQVTSNWAWMTPVIVQIPCALIYGLGIMLFPESPRWLIIKGKEDKARWSFGRFYHKDPYSPEITAQVHEVKTYIEYEKALSSTTSWTEMFHRTYVRRTLISFMVATVVPFSGITFVVNYLAIFLGAIGVAQPFLILIYVSVCGVVGACIGPAVVEYGGRRLAQLCGFSGMASCMLIVGTVATGLGASTTTAHNVLVGFLCIWFFLYATFISSSHWTISAEVHSVRLRTYGQASSVMVENIANFAASFWTPYMINPTAGNLGTDTAYFYFGMDIVGLILLILFLPETGRLSLEQIDDYFASGRKAWKTSLKRNKKIAVGEIYDVSPDAHQSINLAADTKQQGMAEL